MKKIFCILILSLGITGCFSQNNLVDGYIVTVKNDTAFGKLKVKNYSVSRSVKLYTDNKNETYPIAKIKTLNVNGELYVSSENVLWSKSLFKKTVSGSVNLYTNRKNKYLGAYDSDINIEHLSSSLKFYCNDYPGFEDSIRSVSSSNVAGFIVNYNHWKRNNPDSKSYFENNMHKKDLLNFKISFFQPGIGLELGMMENVTINSMLKFAIGWNDVAGLYVNPTIDTQLRFYHNLNQRKNDNIRTYKYSGNYISVVHLLDLTKTNNIVGMEYGWQRTLGKNNYLNVGVGLGRGIENKNIYLLYDLDLGFNF